MLSTRKLKTIVRTTGVLVWVQKNQFRLANPTLILQDRGLHRLADKLRAIGFELKNDLTFDGSARQSISLWFQSETYGAELCISLRLNDYLGSFDDLVSQLRLHFRTGGSVLTDEWVRDQKRRLKIEAIASKD